MSKQTRRFAVGMIEFSISILLSEPLRRQIKYVGFMGLDTTEKTFVVALLILGMVGLARVYKTLT